MTGISDAILDAKATDLVSLIGRTVALKRAGRAFLGCCPFHKEKTPSFRIEPSRGTFHCFGCGVHGTAIDWVMKTENLGFVDAVNRLKENCFASASTFRPAKWAPTPVEDREGFKRALKIWDDSLPVAGTLVEAYLRARGIRGRLTGEIRYAPALYHSDLKDKFPAMVARYSDNAGFAGVQRTYLDHTLPAKADIQPRFQKKCLGAMGVACVRLGEPNELLGLAEGIETALSAKDLYRMPVWATLGSVRLSKVEIPEGVTHVHIFGDPKAQERDAAFKACDEWEGRGISCEVIFPESHFRQTGDGDFNDVVQKGAHLA